ncbi:hypothetical protein [Mycobacterium interjectum]|uniref:hypothetical protein n=1 Tax=Mycobacterium interjectum TaxID=33895 RepID=UPI00082BF420|nr:hypothetical protein [Mycobacterium interjectum]MCV7090199.1 hypothetical protein [Mycobacterium interjectum]
MADAASPDPTTEWDGDGAGGAETTIVPPATAAAPELAWSQDDETEEHRAASPWWLRLAWGRSTPPVPSWRLAFAYAAALVALGVLIAVGVAMWPRPHDDGPVLQGGIMEPGPLPAAALPSISSAPPEPVTTAPVGALPPPTVTVTAAPPPSAKPVQTPRSANAEPPPTEGMFVTCPSGHSGVATTVTSCAFADSVRRAYLVQGGPDVSAYSPVTGETYAMECIGGFTAHLSDGAVVQAVRCTGGDNAVVVVW